MPDAGQMPDDVAMKLAKTISYDGPLAFFGL